MEKVLLYQNELFGNVRVLYIDNRAWFVGKDIAKALGYSNASKAVLTHCKHAIKKVLDVSSQNGNAHKSRKTQEMILINEGDVYRLIVSSKLPKADEFEIWIFDEVLPTIRENGKYIPSQEDIDKEIKERSRTIANSIIKETEKENRDLQYRVTDYIKQQENVSWGNYRISNCMDDIIEILVDYNNNLRRERYTIDDVINRCAVTRQTIVDFLYSSGWIFFDNYKIPHFDPTYLIVMSPDIIFTSIGYDAIEDYFNHRSNPPKLKRNY